MSSDEEQIVGHHTQYRVVEPAWRSDVVTAWLRIFDALHSRAKRSGVYGDQRGSPSRLRIGGPGRSTGREFVPRLPINAYDNVWLNSQVNVEDAVQPGPPVRYFHNVKTLE